MVCKMDMSEGGSVVGLFQKGWVVRPPGVTGLLGWGWSLGYGTHAWGFSPPFHLLNASVLIQARGRTTGSVTWNWV